MVVGSHCPRVKTKTYLEYVSSANGRESAVSFPDLFALLLAPGPPCPRSVDVVDVDL